MLFLDLPTEIIQHIFSSLDNYPTERILGFIPDDPPPNPPDEYLAEDFLLNKASLCNLARTCRRFRTIADSHIFSAPVVGNFLGPWRIALRRWHILYVLEAMVKKRHVSRHVKQMRVLISPHPQSMSGAHQKSELDVVGLRLLHQIIMSFAIPDRMKALWYLGMSRSVVPACVGVLLIMAPRLQTLCLSECLGDFCAVPNRVALHASSPFPGLIENIGIPPEVFTGVLLAPALSYLKLESSLPMILTGIEAFQNLHTLDLSIRLTHLDDGTVRDLLSHTVWAQLRESCESIHHLRLDFQVQTIGIWQGQHSQFMVQIVQAFRNLKSLDFYAEPTESKNPFRSVRAFPHYQMNIQYYPNDLSQTDVQVEDQVHWDQRIYVARTHITDYQWLVDGLVHLQPSLTRLRLPGGFWTLPGGIRKPLPRFDKFTQLSTLSVPQAAILSTRLDNMRFADVKGDFDLMPEVVLPPSLRRLVIFDVNDHLLSSNWLSHLLDRDSAASYWPNLGELDLLVHVQCGGNISRVPSTRQGQHAKIGQLSHALFNVNIMEDDEVPGLNPLCLM